MQDLVHLCFTSIDGFISVFLEKSKNSNHLKRKTASAVTSILCRQVDSIWRSVKSGRDPGHVIFSTLYTLITYVIFVSWEMKTGFCTLTESVVSGGFQSCFADTHTTLAEGILHKAVFVILAKVTYSTWEQSTGNERKQLHVREGLRVILWALTCMDICNIQP